MEINYENRVPIFLIFFINLSGRLVPHFCSYRVLWSLNSIEPILKSVSDFTILDILEQPFLLSHTKLLWEEQELTSTGNCPTNHSPIAVWPWDLLNPEVVSLTGAVQRTPPTVIIPRGADYYEEITIYGSPPTCFSSTLCRVISLHYPNLCIVAIVAWLPIYLFCVGCHILYTIWKFTRSIIFESNLPPKKKNFLVYDNISQVYPIFS